MDFRYLVVPHTHWDREWYLPFEQFRLRLGTVVDGVLDTLENDASFTSFTLDGQAIVLEDYLDVRPDHEERLRALLAEPKVVIGGGFILALIVIALFAPWIAPKNPLDQDLMSASLPPAGLASAEPGYYLGTDDLGRDVLSRLIYGARIALIVAFVAASLAALAGTALGLLAGWYRGWVDGLISRLVDIWMAFPPVLLSILLVAVLGAGVGSVDVLATSRSSGSPPSA